MSETPLSEASGEGRGRRGWSAAESWIANLEIGARIRDRADGAGFGDLLLSEGIPTVALDRDDVVEYFPDGTRRRLGVAS